ncbi:MAG: hypothetical protein ACRC28_13415, partial [Clostridium sp.]|uniref:hypothetical protein n=1 Tax=Clostridium sp. TaxID=1506 RepID=UPI003F2F5C6B
MREKFKIDVVLIMLTMLAIIFRIIDVELAFGININISLVFVILIMLCFGIKKAIIVEGTIIILEMIFFNGEMISIINIIQLIFLWYVCIKKFKLNIILGEIIFSIIGIFPLMYSVYFLSVTKDVADYYKFTILFLIINGILNVFLAELIYVYFIKNKL